MTSVVTAGGVSVTTRDVVEDAQSVLDRLVTDGVPRSLSARGSQPWGAGRLGWLDAPATSRGLLPEFAGSTWDRVLLVAAGGAGIAARAIAANRLTVLDTTDPHRVGTVLAEPLDGTVAVVVDTPDARMQTGVHLALLEQAFREAGLNPAERIVLVAEPDSPLTARGYRLVGGGDGGAYGALGAETLLPAGLAGADVAALLDQAAELGEALHPPYSNPGLALGAALGASALTGRDKLVIADHGSGLTGFGDWIEQLVATSTGKDGKGILPIPVGGVDDPAFPLRPGLRRVILGSRPDEPGPGREAGMSVSGPLGAQFLLWEYATAVAARVIGVDPFEQPDIWETEDQIAALLRRLDEGAAPTIVMGEAAFAEGAVRVHAPDSLLKGAASLTGVFEALNAAVPGHGYLALMAYLDPVREAAAAALRPALAAHGGIVTFGWGPRFLHTTGQFHKGGPLSGVFVQITGDVTRDVPIPGRPYTLGRLQLAQAFGDLRVLRSHGRPAVRIHLSDRAEGIAQLRKALT